MTGYMLSTEEEFLLSKHENTVVFVLDSMGSNLVKEAMEEFPHLEEMFKDFTRFDNSATLYDGTFPTMTYLLTRYRMDFSRPTREFLENSWGNPEMEIFYRPQEYFARLPANF